ncbi:MAG: glycan-binding surface protein [Prevotella sp.]|nr:glycan-binding surface protein [Prevotella sp.]
MKKYIYMLIALVAPLLTACSDDDDVQSVQMTISKVYLQDVDAKDEVYDREVDFARLGQLIRIEGSGFMGLKKVYINGYDTYFNNALMTDNNVWVSLDKKTPVDKADESVRNTIVFVKDNTQTTYQFTVRASAPSIKSVDNTLPKAGEKVTVYGENLQETTKITLPGEIEITDGIESDEDGEWYSFIMPSGVSASGSIISEGANGTAMTPAYFNEFRAFIIDFDGTGEMGSWSATFSADDLVDDPLNSGRGKVCQLIPESFLANGPVADGVSNIKGFWTAGNGNDNDNWNRMTSVIPATTRVDSVALQFDVYVPEAWDLSGQMVITIQNNLSNYGYGSACTKYSKDYINQAYAWVPWLDRETGDHKAFTTGERWQTVTIPLSAFGNYTNSEIDWTFQNVIDDRNAGSYRIGILFCNADIEFSEKITYPSSPFSQKIYVDNFRIVPNTAITVSDF